MSWRSGKNSDAKKLLIKLPDERGDDELYMLDKSQIKALLSLSASLGWRTRHLAFPIYINTSDKLEAWADETVRDLMMPVDFCAQLASCEEELAAILANLIAENTSVQQALRDFLSNDQQFITNIFKERPLPVETLNPDTESLGILFAQCVGIVSYTHNAINDLFDVLEVQSNNVELMSNLRLIPGLATMMDAAGASQFITLIDYLLSTMNEMYEAQWEETPPTGTKWIIACKLFCLCKEDKIINVDRIFATYVSLMSQYTAITWDNVQELVESIVGVNDNSEVMVYATHLMMWTTAKLAGTFGLETITNNVLQIILKLENVPNDDWEVLCLDCPPELDPNCRDMKSSKFDWYPAYANGAVSTDTGVWTSGQGLGPFVYAGPIPQFFWAKGLEADKSISAITIYTNENISNLVFGRIGNSGVTMDNPLNPRKVIRFDATTHPTMFPTSLETFKIYLTTTNNLSTTTFRIEQICYEYV